MTAQAGLGSCLHKRSVAETLITNRHGLRFESFKQPWDEVKTRTNLYGSHRSRPPATNPEKNKHGSKTNWTIPLLDVGRKNFGRWHYCSAGRKHLRRGRQRVSKLLCRMLTFVLKDSLAKSLWNDSQLSFCVTLTSIARIPLLEWFGLYWAKKMGNQRQFNWHKDCPQSVGVVPTKPAKFNQSLHSPSIHPLPW